MNTEPWEINLYEERTGDVSRFSPLSQASFYWEAVMGEETPLLFTQESLHQLSLEVIPRILEQETEVEEVYDPLQRCACLFGILYTNLSEGLSREEREMYLNQWLDFVRTEDITIRKLGMSVLSSVRLTETDLQFILEEFLIILDEAEEDLAEDLYRYIWGAAETLVYRDEVGGKDIPRNLRNYYALLLRDLKQQELLFDLVPPKVIVYFFEENFDYIVDLLESLDDQECDDYTPKTLEMFNTVAVLALNRHPEFLDIICRLIENPEEYMRYVFDSTYAISKRGRLLERENQMLSPSVYKTLESMNEAEPIADSVSPKTTFDPLLSQLYLFLDMDVTYMSEDVVKELRLNKQRLIEALEMLSIHTLSLSTQENLACCIACLQEY